MDEFLSALGQSLAHAGPEYVTALGMVAVVAWVASKAMPLYASHQAKRLEIEQARETRKADEAARQDERDRERAKLEGRWLEQYEHATQVQAQTNAVMAGVEAQMTTLNATLADSKDRSRSMADEVHEVHAAVVRRND